MAEYLERKAAVMRLMQDGCSAKNVQSIMELPAAVSVPQWISVKERLPKTGENPVLAGSTEMHYVNMAWYHSGKGVWETPSGFSCSFTHWMPLPKPPKGENDG
jgi:hypothetical protein